MPGWSITVSSMGRLPLLDIAVWRSDPSRFARQLRHACHHDGFFQLRHRIPTPLVEHVKSEACSFFAQEAEHKDAIDYRGSPAFRGYMACGVENTAGRPDLREQVEIAAEGDAAPDAWPPYHRLRGPNQWPPAQPSMQPAVTEYTQHMLQVSSELTHALCASLGLEHSVLDAWFRPAPHWQLKLASYQPLATDAGGGAAADALVGVGAHTDSGWLTCLLQVRLWLRLQPIAMAAHPAAPSRHVRR